MEVDANPTQEDITRSDSIALQDGPDPWSTTRPSNIDENKLDTRSNTLTSGTVIEPATGHNILTENATTRSNNGVLIENPFATEYDENEKLEDLGLDLAKMRRILAREITRSLSKALIPLQQELNELKTFRSATPLPNKIHDIMEENDRLKTKVEQLELNNYKLKERLSHTEDKLLENNLLFFGINERDGETKYERYGIILDIISTNFC